MDRKRKGLILIALGIAILLPALAFAQNAPGSGAGLVPCGVTSGALFDSDVKVATECQACHLVELTQNIINFVIGLAVSLAVLLIAWGGVLYVFSGGDPSKIEKAKRVFRDTFFGFLVAITAWIVINTGLYMFLDSKQFPESSWFDISCVNTKDRPIASNIGEIITGAIGVAQLPIGVWEGVNGKQYTCPQGYIAEGETVEERICVDKQGQPTDPIEYVPPPPGSGGGSYPTIGSCGGGRSSASIAACAQLYAIQKLDSSNCSPYVDGGNLACACMVNKILNSAGYASIDGDSVPQMRRQLDAGAGVQIGVTQTQPGDIVIWLRGDLEKHVGICANIGCTMTYSNSSSKHYVRPHAVDALGYTSYVFYHVR